MISIDDIVTVYLKSCPYDKYRFKISSGISVKNFCIFWHLLAQILADRGFIPIIFTKVTFDEYYGIKIVYREFAGVNDRSHARPAFALDLEYDILPTGGYTHHIQRHPN